MINVSIVKGDSRKENIKTALSLIKEDINKSIKKKNSRTLFIKVNAMEPKNPLSCTHPEALEAVLEVFYNKFSKIIIGDNSYTFETKNHPYRYLINKFKKIEFSDLTKFNSKKINFKTIHGDKKAKICLLPKNAFTISLALPKCHDVVVFTGTSKNMFGCVIKNRSALHGLEHLERIFLKKLVKANKLVNKNLELVIKTVYPDLAILDAFTGMEKNGPIFGTKIELGYAMASLDCVSLDKISYTLAGFYKVKYLDFFKDKKVNIIKKGFKNLSNLEKKFKPHYLIKYQLMEDVNELIPFLPNLDFKIILSILKRPHRIVAKVFEIVKERFKPIKF